MNPHGTLQESYCSATGRTALLDDDEVSVWVYLTEPGNRRPHADCVLVNRISLIDPDALDQYRDGPPPLTTRYGREEAVLPPGTGATFGFRWATDGESVAILLNDQPWAVLSAESTRGMTKAVARSGPFGNEWDPEQWAAFDRG